MTFFNRPSRQGPWQGRKEPDLHFESDEEAQQYAELEKIMRESRRGSPQRRDAIEELRKMRKRIEDRDRREW